MTARDEHDRIVWRERLDHRDRRQLRGKLQKWPSTGPGFARVFSGVDGSILYELAGDTVGDLFGEAVGTAGDVDEDGLPDFFVGLAIPSSFIKPVADQHFCFRLTYLHHCT